MEKFSFNINGYDIEYFVIRNHIEKIKIVVEPNGRVNLFAPYYMCDKEIMDFVEKNAIWIYGTIYKFEVEAGKRKIVFNFIYKDRNFKYKIIRKNMKNIITKINNGEIIVSAPFLVDDESVKNAVLENKSWIYDNMIKYENNRCNKKLYKTFENGDKLKYLGEEFTLNVIEENDNSIRIDTDNKIFYLKTEDINDIELNKEIYETIQKSHAKFYFRKILNRIYEKVEYLGILYPQMTVRTMKTKWGSCSYKKNRITLNVYLIEHSIELIELVILHELLHFIHPNHSSEFYKLNEKIMPDYKKREEQLNKEIIREI